jgi:hypothetical protein
MNCEMAGTLMRGRRASRNAMLDAVRRLAGLGVLLLVFLAVVLAGALSVTLRVIERICAALARGRKPEPMDKP